MADILLNRGLCLALFDGTLNESLEHLLRRFPPAFCKAKTAVSLLQALWRVVYQSIWVPRCEETVRTERVLGIRPTDKRQTHAGPTEPRPAQTSLGFGRSQAQDRQIWALCLP